MNEIRHSRAFKERKRLIRSTVLKSLRAGASMYDACKAAGVDYVTFWMWRQKQPKLELIVNKILDARVAVVEDALFKSAVGGWFPAQQYFLNNMAHKRWNKNPGEAKVLQQQFNYGDKDGSNKPTLGKSDLEFQKRIQSQIDGISEA